MIPSEQSSGLYELSFRRFVANQELINRGAGGEMGGGSCANVITGQEERSVIQAAVEQDNIVTDRTER